MHAMKEMLMTFSFVFALSLAAWLVLAGALDSTGY